MLSTAEKAVVRFSFKQSLADIGQIWPKSAVVRLPMFFRIGPDVTYGIAMRTSGVGVRANGIRSYAGSIVTYPYRPLANLLDNTATAPVTAPTASVPGWTRFMGTAGSGATTVYSKCCVLRMDYSLRMTFVSQHTTTSNYTAVNSASLPGTHVLFPAPAGIGLTQPTTVDILTNNCAMPEAKVKYTGPSTGFSNFNSGTITQLLPAVPGQHLLWKGTLYPHQVVASSFQDYVSSSTSFGTSTAAASNSPVINLVGQFPDYCPADVPGSAPDYGWIDGHVVFTCLLKDVVGTLS